MITESGIYDTFDDFLDEFHPGDPEARERVQREAERLAAEERGARLVELRERAQATREGVAKRMGVSVAHVIELETGAFSLAHLNLELLEVMEDHTPDQVDETTREQLASSVRFIHELVAYIQAIGGDLNLEVTQEDSTTFYIPAPTEFFDVDLLYGVLKDHRPTRLRVLADVDGYRVEVA